MIQSKTKFLDELASGLGNYEDKQSVLLEYEAHIDEIILENFTLQNEGAMMEKIVERLGTPEEICSLWQEELSVTPDHAKWHFIVANVVFFVAGSLLTVAHNLLEWKWLTAIWSHLSAIPTLIALVYLFFWALLGYEIGKSFGHGGKKLMRNTFFISVVPNLLLMILTLTRMIPKSWFAPLLTEQFIIACIFFTMLLYPVCWLGFRWGKKASV